MIFSGARRFGLLLAGVRGRAVLALAAAGVLGCFGVLAPAAGAATAVTCGSSISTPGSYFLAADCSGSGIEINASKVTLQLNGHTMTGPSSGPGVGAVAGSFVKVLGPGTITGYTVGVVLGFNVSGSTVNGLTADNNGPTGGVLVAGNGNTIQGNTAENNVNGFEVRGSGNKLNDNTINDNQVAGVQLYNGANDNTLNDNTVDNNHFGIFDGGGNDNTISDNTADNNSNSGIEVSGRGDTINDNTALGNVQLGDLIDANPGCDSNTWKDNTFNFADQTCIH